jgi:hypothetical protein
MASTVYQDEDPSPRAPRHRLVQPQEKMEA